MAISDHKVKWAVATSFAVLTASSTVYAQSFSSDSSPSEGEFTVNEENRVGSQTVIRSVTQGYRKSISQRMSASQRSSKKLGGQGVREDSDTAFTEPTYFGPATNGAVSGLAAGEATSGLGTFANFSLTQSDSNAGGFQTETGLGVISLGVDKAFQDNFILGISLSGSSSTSDSDFTVGGTKFTSSNKSSSISFAPYMAVIINENFYVDATLGVSGGQNSINHTFVGTGVVVQSGDDDFTSEFLSTGINYTNTVFGNYGLQASASYTWTNTARDDFVDDQGNTNNVSDDRASQLILGGQLGRQFDNLFPYVLSYYEYDLIKAPRGGGLTGGPGAETGRSALRLGAGLDATFDALTASVEVNTLQLKSGYEEYGLAINLRYDF